MSSQFPRRTVKSSLYPQRPHPVSLSLILPGRRIRPSCFPVQHSIRQPESLIYQPLLGVSSRHPGDSVNLVQRKGHQPQTGQTTQEDPRADEPHEPVAVPCHHGPVVSLPPSRPDFSPHPSSTTDGRRPRVSTHKHGPTPQTTTHRNGPTPHRPDRLKTLPNS